MQGVILFDVLRRWSQYLNRCVAALDLELVEAPGANVPFSLEPILVELEGGCYIGRILPASLSDIVTGRHPSGEGSPKSGGGGSSSTGN